MFSILFKKKLKKNPCFRLYLIHNCRKLKQTFALVLECHWICLLSIEASNSIQLPPSKLFKKHHLREFDEPRTKNLENGNSLSNGINKQKPQKNINLLKLFQVYWGIVCWWPIEINGICSEYSILCWIVCYLWAPQNRFFDVWSVSFMFAYFFSYHLEVY